MPSWWSPAASPRATPSTSSPRAPAWFPRSPIRGNQYGILVPQPAGFCVTWFSSVTGFSVFENPVTEFGSAGLAAPVR